MTTKNTGNPCGFAEGDFIMENYENYPSSFCDLQNENLFPSSKFPIFRERNTPAARNAYTLIQPALLLISRIIIQRWESSSIFVQRRHPDLPGVRLDAAEELEVSKDEILRCIKNAIPDIDFGPAIHPISSPFAETTLRPNTMSDLITFDYNIIRLLKDSTSTHSQKLAGLVFLAVLLGHGLAHVLEFRSSRAGQLRSNNEPFETPPGITCRKAGTAWETRAFGGRVYPVCQVENLLLTIRGLCIENSAWNFDMMKVNENWTRQLFTESYWTMAPHPLRPPIDKYARYAILEDELIDERCDLLIKSRYENDVRVELGSPRKKHRPITPVNICGGKKVQMGSQERAPGTRINS
ncbi:hypothetical protein ANOM_007091 [Aspergillus nomiae NRRL 13137]|uniref:Uncharacterized protein n=1 Tax=Aspergillus nomiae NRRL (strain ATCC 15546 / NRRL 13137 / CBS 260.88 / M93) TaxID=1509407 RepID=A0A0L1IZY4_ASPN3|nr:uncharacterized protein ANOM_007091 [Aspergillus nomiae NRRL 13137]KNG85121.1 hypothetical protein ANOM_007091 [Aspergillus nomiae NRRL 13137]